MEIGDRMKTYEGRETERTLMPGLPVCIRLDGRAFHTFTRGLERPFDIRFRDLMTEVTKSLVSETNARVGYTQSDEISLVLWNEDPVTEMYFKGRIQKVNSMLSAFASVTFNRLLPKFLPEKAQMPAYFDCRVWNVPSLEEAANTIMWRELDATKNSIASAAQSMFAFGELQGLDSKQLQELMFSKRGVNWNDYPSQFKRGVYCFRQAKEIPFTPEEIQSLPEKHAARSNPALTVKRSVIMPVELPPLMSVANRVGTLFKGESPVIRIE